MAVNFRMLLRESSRSYPSVLRNELLERLYRTSFDELLIASWLSTGLQVCHMKSATCQIPVAFDGCVARSPFIEIRSLVFF